MRGWITIKKRYTGRRVGGDVHLDFLLAKVFVPGLQNVRTLGDILDPEFAFRAADGMERMVVDPEVGLHPPMHVALDDVVARTGDGADGFGLVGTEGQVPVEKTVKVDRMKDRIAVGRVNAAAG